MVLLKFECATECERRGVSQTSVHTEIIAESSSGGDSTPQKDATKITQHICDKTTEVSR
jgi:hypothetical protein